MKHAYGNLDASNVCGNQRDRGYPYGLDYSATLKTICRNNYRKLDSDTGETWSVILDVRPDNKRRLSHGSLHNGTSYCRIGKFPVIELDKNHGFCYFPVVILHNPTVSEYFYRCSGIFFVLK